MRIFITGASGFIGSAIVRELIDAGHRVLGLARSHAAARALATLGAEAHRGELADVQSLAAGARECDGVIHAAFNHDWANYAAAAQTDRQAIETLGAALAGTNHPLLVTSGTLLAQRTSALATEQNAPDPNFPRKSEDAALSVASKGVRVSVLRLPPSVHGDGDRGFIPALIALARQKGASAYVGDGLNRWPTVHRLDAARLYGLALEKGAAGATYHAVADQGVPFREIAQVIGRRLNIPVVSKTPEEAAGHFGWLAHFVGVDCPASSAQTQQSLGWRPVQALLIPDIDRPTYFEA
jgi:nucleoside-diphosphate-sugar epimerase